MKTIFSLLVVVAMMAVAFGQYYNYGYNTHTPGASVSHHASSGVGVPGYAYNYGVYGAGHPYRWW